MGRKKYPGYTQWLDRRAIDRPQKSTWAESYRAPRFAQWGLRALTTLREKKREEEEQKEDDDERWSGGISGRKKYKKRAEGGQADGGREKRDPRRITRRTSVRKRSH